MTFSAPNSDQIVKFLFAATLGSLLLLISGLSCTTTVIFLAMATPALVFFSPILVPAGIVISLVVSGFLLSSGLAVAALPALSWIWKYLPRNHLLRSDPLENARKRIENLAGEARNSIENLAREARNRIENLAGETNHENEEEATAVEKAEEATEEEKAEGATAASEKSQW